MTTASIFLRARLGRTADFTIELFESDGTTAFNLQTSDNVRIKIGRGQEEPVLDLDSADPTPNGSAVTFTNATNDVALRLAQGDTQDLEPGAYDLEITVVDASETAPVDAIKHVQDGVVFFHPTMAGSVGPEESSGSSSSGDSSGSSSSSS